MNIKILRRILIYLLCFALAVPLASCSEKEREVVFRVSGDYIQWRYSDTELWSDLISISDLNENGALSGKSAYEIAVSQGFVGSEKEWIESLVGAKGEDGANGKDGQSVYIGENGNWWIGDKDTGVSVLSQGDESIYAVPNFVGMTLSEIQQMPKSQNFVLSYYGDSSEGVVVSQSIPAGVVALEGTQIDIYMSNYIDDGEGNPTGSPTEPPSATIRLKYVTTPIQKGKEATVEIIGAPNTEYTIKVYYASGNLSTSKALVPTQSDENGNVSWTWRIGSNTKIGTAKVIVSDDTSSLTLYMEIVE